MLLSSLKPGLWILFWISVSILVGMLVLFSYLGMTEVKDSGGFVPLTVLGWMYDPATAGIFPITLISTFIAVGSFVFLKFYPGFQTTPLTVTSVTAPSNTNIKLAAANNKISKPVTNNKPANTTITTINTSSNTSSNTKVPNAEKVGGGRRRR